MMLKGERLSFRYGGNGRQILTDLSLSIESGEAVGLCAPSGRGKTTLCKILGGYIRPDSGCVTLDGKPIFDYRGYCPVQLVWQHPELVVNPRRRMAGVLEEAGNIEQRILDGLGIEPEWMARYPAELSGGELQRFCIARALQRETRFILADEISTMLDLITQAQIWQFLKRETEERGIGLLVVSHSDSLLERVCTRYLNLESQ